ncbi:MAG TPA: riboflavin synthase [Gemmatimonadaceae bacterium]|nr:riboflavin synthase [Gemmatimonadaceae bacterium]
MFTGLIDDVGTIDRVAATVAGRELRVRCRYGDLAAGESIALNGACLTIRECGAQWFTVAAVRTTLDRTTIAEWQPGRRVNLERALRVGDRLGGHLVQGHVDGVGEVTAVRQAGDVRLVDVSLPAVLIGPMIVHGSIAVDGVSLTVNERPAPGVVQLSLIEYTLRHTALDMLVPGARVHLEADMIGRYVQQLMTPHMKVEPSPAGRTLEPVSAEDSDGRRPAPPRAPDHAPLRHRTGADRD